MVVRLNLERMKRKKQRKPAMSLIANKVEEALGFGALPASSAVIHFKHPHLLFNSGILVC